MAKVTVLQNFVSVRTNFAIQRLAAWSSLFLKLVTVKLVKIFVVTWLEFSLTCSLKHPSPSPPLHLQSVLTYVHPFSTFTLCTHNMHYNLTFQSTFSSLKSSVLFYSFQFSVWVTFPALLSAHLCVVCTGRISVLDLNILGFYLTG